MKNLVLIGHGYWGKNLERVIQKNKNLFNLVGIVDTKYENKISKNVSYFDSLKSVVESDVKIDCAVISTPATEHYKITKTALQNNIHCLVEKPFVLKSSQANELFKLAKSNGLILMVDNTFLYDNSIIELVKQVNSKKFGNVLHINFERTNLGPLREDVSALWDLTSHDISILLAINNVLPTKININGAKFTNKNIADVVITTFFQKKIFISSVASWLHPEKTRIIKIVGEKGMIVWNGMDLNQELKLYSNTKLNKSTSSDDLYMNLTNTKNSGFTVPYVRKSEPLDMVFKDFYKRLTKKPSNNLNREELVKNQIKVLEQLDKKLTL
tara:strand:+ start:413 stop:1393 length:981 start_codon:yes stop_codon:yes gene_type:complete